MSKETEVFISIGENLNEAIQSHLFGKPCFKINGKAFICFYQNDMVFKLTGTDHTEALALNGAQLFDPSGKNRPMKEWVQVPFDHKNEWSKYAKLAFDYVNQKK